MHVCSSQYSLSEKSRLFKSENEQAYFSLTKDNKSLKLLKKTHSHGWLNFVFLLQLSIN